MRRSMLTLTSTAFLLSSTVFAIAISACGSSDPQPAQSPSATAYPQQYPPGQYPPGQYPQQQGGYPQQQQPYPQQTAYPQPQPQPYPSAPGTATGQMATPGPLALPCSNDGACGLHRCNVAAGKCAFPCQTPVDCAAGNQCLMGVCAPKAPGSP